jgi:hypothetical protein
VADSAFASDFRLLPSDFFIFILLRLLLFQFCILHSDLIIVANGVGQIEGHPKDFYGKLLPTTIPERPTYSTPHQLKLAPAVYFLRAAKPFRFQFDCTVARERIQHRPGQAVVVRAFNMLPPCGFALDPELGQTPGSGGSEERGALG